jgi:fatty acid desaturase
MSARRRRGDRCTATPPRWRFTFLARLLPGVDAERVWMLRDLYEPLPGEVLLERRIASALARICPLVLAGVTLTFAAGLVLVWGVGPRLDSAAAPLVAAIVVHGLFILVVHEAAHGNLLGRPADDWVGAVASGALLLPFVAETFAAVHLLHHRRTNQPGDTNWSPFRERLFRRSRLLYACYELVPLVNGFDRVGARRSCDRRRVAVAWIAALVVIALFRPPFRYWLRVVVGLNAVTAVRFWTEHFDVGIERAAHTYRFPLSFGIGNHAVHHDVPGLCAPALAIGLWFRRKDASAAAAPLRILLSRRYRHLCALHAELAPTVGARDEAVPRRGSRPSARSAQ